MKNTLLPALRVLALLTVLSGFAYPFLITAAARAVFPGKARGSPIIKDGKLRGSSLLAQEFKSERYFFPRPSAGNYATVASTASNLGPTSATLQELVARRRTGLQQTHGLTPSASVPEELLLSSGSGLDPHLSPQAAHFQVDRVAHARGLDPARVRAMVDQMTEHPQLGFLGETRVNVLLLNLALDAQK